MATYKVTVTLELSSDETNKDGIVNHAYEVLTNYYSENGLDQDDIDRAIVEEIAE